MFHVRPAYDPPAMRGDARRVAALLAVMVAAGLIGWAGENALFGARYSKALGGERAAVPLLPVYAVGGAVLAATIPSVRALSLPARFGAYALGLTALEYGACKVDALAGGARSWRYSGGIDSGGCVDVPHAVAWGLLGLLVERVASLLGWGSP